MNIVGQRANQITSSSAAEIHKMPLDALAPCALGHSITQELVPHLKCQIIAGAENNPLDHPNTEGLLFKRQILYVPDYVINAGGIIVCGAEYFERKIPFVDQQIQRIPQTIASILKQSREAGKLPGVIAKEMAEAALTARKMPS